MMTEEARDEVLTVSHCTVSAGSSPSEVTGLSAGGGWDGSPTEGGYNPWCSDIEKPYVWRGGMWEESYEGQAERHAGIYGEAQSAGAGPSLPGSASMPDVK